MNINIGTKLRGDIRIFQLQIVLSIQDIGAVKRGSLLSIYSFGRSPNMDIA